MKYCLYFLLSPFLTAFTLLFFQQGSFCQAPNLGATSSFILFTTVGAVSNTGVSRLTGNVGSNDGAITGFEGLHGEVHNADALTLQCSIDLLSAYNQLDTTPATFFPLPVLGNGQILFAGVYAIPQAASLNADLTLDAQGNSNAVFIFKIAGAFSSGASSTIHLINGALASNIFWKVEGGVSLAAGTVMKGTIVANNGAIGLGAGSTLDGRALSTTGALSVYGVIVPVKLLDFKGTNVAKAIKLTWTTANEYSIASYELERSEDGSTFNTIAWIAPTNTPITKTYNWLDNTPFPVINFYRLKIIDIDKIIKYSSSIKIYTNKEKSISVYPNPVTGNVLHLQMYGQLKGEHTISLYNSDNKKVMSSSRITFTGSDPVRSINLKKGLPAGIYYLEINDPGENKNTLKILIN